jgi:4-alpha-glucanotransferase
LHPEKIRLQHHGYTIAYIRNHLRYARMLRIDHVMGLHRLFCIPNGLTGDKGVYVEYPAEEQYAILSVESHRHQAGIVGENLGTVPPEVNAAMRRHNVQQMYVVQYEVVGEDPKRALRSVPANTVASLNTHDMPPFRAFLDGEDIEDRLKLKFLSADDAKKERQRRAAVKKILVEFLQHKKFLREGIRVSPEAIFRATVEFLAASMANVVLINLEDLWQETLPQNVPATHNERPNWRRRMRKGIEEVEGWKEAAELLRLVEKGRRQRR